MKIVYIVSTLERSGPINILYNILKNFDFKENSISIITLSSEKSDTRINDFRRLGCEIYSLKLSRVKGFFYGGLKVKKLIKDINPQIVHSHGFRADILAWLYLKDYKRVSTLHNYPFEDYVMAYGKIIGTVMSCLSVAAYKQMELSIPCSYSIQDKLTSHLKKNTLVIQNGVDFNKHQNQFKHIKMAKKTLGISEEKLVFIYLGKLIKRKDPHTILTAFCNVFDDNEAELLIVGSGELEHELQHSFNNKSNIKFIGHVNNPTHYLSASDYYISASFSEGFPTAVLEAMSLGLPVILSSIPPHKEMLNVTKNNAGLLFDVGSISDLEVKMQHIKNLDYNELSKSAKDLVENHFSSQIMAKKYLNAYNALER